MVHCVVCDINYPLLDRIAHGAMHFVESRPIDSLPSSEDHFTVPEFVIEEGYEQLYLLHRKYIKPSRTVKKLSAVYNFQLHRFSMEEVKEHLLGIFRDQTTAFKIKISLGYILRNTEDQALSYYYASSNNQLLFKDPFFVGNIKDLNIMTKKLDALDLLHHVAYPNSKFTFERITNVTFYVSKVLRCPIGTAIDFPAYLKNNRGLNCLVTRKGKTYQDNLCFFRCVALFRGARVTALEMRTRELFQQYLAEAHLPASDFEGISLNELEEASRIFDIGIFVFSLSESGITENLFRTLKEDNVMYINLHHTHFSFIKDLNKFSRCYRCEKCNKLFPTHFRQRRHTATCDAATRDIYTGGAFEPNRTIFDQLGDFGIEIPAELRYFQYRACFDIECALIRDTGINNSARVEYSSKHLLASISVCSNVPGHLRPVCLISTGCERDLVKRFIALITEISQVSFELMQERFSEYLTAIHQIDDEKVVDRFEEYLKQMPLLSFYGQKYDIPTMRSQLFATLLQCEEFKYIIRKGRAYSAISTETLLFLDVSNYLAAGTSYNQFLKAYGATAHKSFFPYEYFDSLEKLSTTTFPPYEAFFSSVRGGNSLEPAPHEILSAEEQYVANQYPRPDNSTSLSIDQIMGVASYRYDMLRQMFEENQWTFGDLLAFYNNRYIYCIVSVF